MTRKPLLSIHDISKELNAGTATTKFILKRFETWFRPETVEGRPYYSGSAIPLLLKIRQYLDEGLLPSEIDQKLEARTPDPQRTNPPAHFTEQENQDIRVSKGGLTLIKSLFEDISEQQQRIAAAHEKRAMAEERKAAAIEKRAEAEEKKAAAMNNIAAALQEMNRQRVQDPSTLAVARGAVEVLEADTEPVSATPDLPPAHPPERVSDPDLTQDTDLMDDLDLPDLADEDFLSDLDDLTRSLDETLTEDTLDLPGTPSLEQVEVDDLYALVEDQQTEELSELLELPVSENDELDDLDALLNTVSMESADTKGTDSPLDPAALDDLARLLDDVSLEPSGSTGSGADDPDDLSLLLPDEPPATGLDDLSRLVAVSEPNLDDLSALIASEPENMRDNNGSVDDLSLLIDTKKANTPGMDDLSALVTDTPPHLDDLEKLIEHPPEKPSSHVPPIDDLAVLIEKKAEPEPVVKSLKPDVSREENLQAYKAAVMKIILQLKNQGLSPQETTDRLNRDGVETISGKPQWQAKAMAQIYKFMDAAK